MQCPQCGRQYDVTLFEFGRSIACDCGVVLDALGGHVARVGHSRAAEWVEAIPSATWAYFAAPHIAEDYDSYFAHNELFKFDVQVLDRWLATPGRLLDLGCGTGRHLVHFAERGYEVTGVDLSEHMLAVTRRKLAASGVSATLVRGNLVELDALGLGTFDYAICMFSTLGMIYGAGNRLRFLEAVRRRLRPDGRFAFHVHNRWHNLWDAEGRRYLRRAAWDWFRGRPEAFQKDMDGYRGLRHMTLYIFSAREVRRLAARAGFEVAEFVWLNEARSGELRGAARGLRANGFIVLCRPAPGGGAGAAAGGGRGG